MSKLSLAGFPYEILMLIANYLPDYKDINKFSQTCTKIHHVMEERWEKYSIQEKDGWQALCWAIRKQDNEFVKYLVGRKSIDVNYQDSLGLTPLHWGIRSGGMPSIITTWVLLTAGANLTLVDNAGFTPLQWAVQHNQAVVEYLLTWEREIAKPKSINIQDRSGQTALHRAAARADEYLVNQLLKAGADVEITCGLGRTPLIWAASKKSLPVIKILVEEKGSNVHHVTDDGRNVLHLAATEGTVESVNYFAGKGVDMGAQDIQGRTPLHWAAMYGNARTLRALLKLGGDPTIKNKNEQTVKDYASTFPPIGDALRDFGIAVPKPSWRLESRFTQYARSKATMPIF